MDLFTPEELAQVQAYHAPRYVAAALDLAFSLPVMALLARYATGPVYRWAERTFASWDARSAVLTRLWGGPGWAPALGFAFGYFGLLALLALPQDVYFGHVQERAFGMSRQSLASFAWDVLKGHLVWALALGCLTLGMLGLARRATWWWWVMGLVCGAVLLASGAVDPYRSRLYVEQSPLPAGPLRSRLEALLARAHVSVADILVERTSEKTVRLQAYFAGQGPTRTVVLNDSLLAALEPDEVAAAVAHEAGHVHEPRWPRWVASAVTLLGFLGAVEWLLRRTAARGWFGVTRRADVRALPLVVLLFDVGATVAGPVSAWDSRAREREADRYALALTGDPRALEGVLVKAARTNKMDPSPPAWYRPWMSHPPVVERIAAARAFARPAAAGP